MDKKAAIYIRVSTDAQAEEGYSIDAQKEQLTAYCVSKGIKNYDYYIDGGWSGSNIDRPELVRLIDDCKDGKISHCIVYKLDRLSRSQKDTLYLIEDVFNIYNVAFVSITETLDTSTPVGRLMIGILSAFAQLERENIRMRTRMGMLERVKEGYWMGGGRVPFGYDYDSYNGILVPNEYADLVRKMYDLYLSGYSFQKIANVLGLKYEKLAQQIIKRKTNYGVIEYNGEIYQGRHEPLISKETYDACMEEMERRSTTRVTTSKYLLSGLCYCSQCGAKMRYQKWGKDKVKLVCYSQQKSKQYLVKDANCDMDKILSTELEEIVLDNLFQLKEKKNVDTIIRNTSIIDELKANKDKLENKIKRLYNLYADSDDDILIETIQENKKQLATIEEKIKKELEQDETLKNLGRCEKVINGLKDRWEYMTFDEQQNVVRLLIEKIIISKDTVDIQLTF